MKPGIISKNLVQGQNPLHFNFNGFGVPKYTLRLHQNEAVFKFCEKESTSKCNEKILGYNLSFATESRNVVEFIFR